MKFRKWKLGLAVLVVAGLLQAVTINRLQVGDTEFHVQIRDVPSATTQVTAVDTFVTDIWLTNRTATAITITIEDKQGTPYELFEVVSIGANTFEYAHFVTPFKFTGGIDHSASVATGLNVSYRGWQQ